jgi:hypothetical protein
LLNVVKINEFDVKRLLFLSVALRFTTTYYLFTVQFTMAQMFIYDRTAQFATVVRNFHNVINHGQTNQLVQRLSEYSAMFDTLRTEGVHTRQNFLPGFYSASLIAQELGFPDAVSNFFLTQERANITPDITNLWAYMKSRRESSG